jgi:hypothetical protein
MKTKIFKILMVGCALAFSSPLMAHDEGHGPKLTDTGKFGGILTAVVEAKDASKGNAALLVYKGELTRSEDKTVRVYVYDKDMKMLPATLLNPKAEAKILTMVGGKETVTPFVLTFENKAYVGKMPEPSGKPYNIDVTFRSGDKDLLAAFDNLD